MVTAAENQRIIERVRSLVVRRADGRIATGLAGGIADRLGVADAYVRAAFVALTFAGGVGAALYAIGSAIAVEGNHSAAERVNGRQATGLALTLFGSMLFLRGAGLWFGDGLVWSATLLAFGTAAMWDRTSLFETSRDPGEAPGGARVIVGALLLVAGLATFAGNLDALDTLAPAVAAAALTAVGFMLIFGSWATNLARDLAEERRNRIRSEERSDVAAHLHDSLLQTLALIQRADDPKRMITLARAQERDLRSWLYGSERSGLEGGLQDALQQAAARVEHDHDVPIDVVVVGHATVDKGLAAMVKAAGEAMTNAARHSGAERVSVFAEVTDHAVDVYVTDQGRGFDPSTVPADRHGIADSIIARLERNGGNATIVSGPGDGTEIHLVLPREQS